MERYHRCIYRPVDLDHTNSLNDADGNTDSHTVSDAKRDTIHNTEFDTERDAVPGTERTTTTVPHSVSAARDYADNDAGYHSHSRGLAETTTIRHENSGGQPEPAENTHSREAADPLDHLYPDPDPDLRPGHTSA